jgi:IS30 family transposase
VIPSRLMGGVQGRLRGIGAPKRTKPTDLSIYTQADLDAVAARLNARPRKTLEYQTPAAMLAAIVASTP